MKKLTRLLTLAFLFAIITGGCKKEEAGPLPAKIEFTMQEFIFGTAKPSPNAKIQLFKSDADRAAKTNAATAELTADANGVINVDNLEPIRYYFNAVTKDGSKSNEGKGNTIGPLTRGQTEKMAVMLQ